MIRSGITFILAELGYLDVRQELPRQQRSLQISKLRLFGYLNRQCQLYLAYKAQILYAKVAYHRANQRTGQDMVLEFPTSRNGWRLDAVGLLAVIGETTTETCVQAMTSSWFCLLPRLIPAPQALIRPNRRIALPSVNAIVTSVHSRTNIPQLSYAANQIFPISNLAPFSVHKLVIKRRESPAVQIHGLIDAERSTGSADVANPRSIGRRSTLRALANLSETYYPPVPVMRVKPLSPHNILSIASFVLTIGLLVWAAIIADGPATIAISLLAVATTLFCAAALWRPKMGSRRVLTKHPGDVVIRTPNSAFVVVKCDEAIAGELYFQGDDIEQAITKGFGLFVGVGTVIFMVAVILMGNSSWTMQAALAVTYLLLNAVYWIVALLPAATHWDFPRYECSSQEVKQCQSMTEAIWTAILIIRKVGWAWRGGCIPQTEEWDEWLKIAELNMCDGNVSWDAVGEQIRIVGDENDLSRANRVDIK
jgi:hypothetical protein